MEILEYLVYFEYPADKIALRHISDVKKETRAEQPQSMKTDQTLILFSLVYVLHFLNISFEIKTREKYFKNHTYWESL